MRMEVSDDAARFAGQLPRLLGLLADNEMTGTLRRFGLPPPHRNCDLTPGRSTEKGERAIVWNR
jgi:hypothetical protein